MSRVTTNSGKGYRHNRRSRPQYQIDLVDTVLVDQETIYAPRHGNDRLLLGLKGSLNEYELDLLRQRLALGPLREGAPGRHSSCGCARRLA